MYILDRSTDLIQNLKGVELDTLEGTIINPDPPFQAMERVEIYPVTLADAVVGMGDCDRLGMFKIEDGNFVELEDGEMSTAVYNLYEFTIDRYNEKQSLIDPDFVDKLGFKSIRFLMKNVGMSLLNDNITYNKRLLDDYVMTVDFSNNDIRANILGLDSPWAMYTSKQRNPGPVDITSNTITVDTVDTPNILDQDINYDSWPVQQTRTRDASSNDEYLPQEYQTIDGKIVRKQVGISGYNIDLDIYCLRSLTVTPTSFPYTFSIADYNSGYNTNYVGIRNLTINDGSGGGSGKIEITKFNYKTGYYTWDEFTQGTGSSVTIPSMSVIIYYDNDHLFFTLYFRANVNSSSRTVTLGSSYYYKIISHPNESVSTLFLMNDDDQVVQYFGDSDTADNSATRIYFNQNLFTFKNALGLH